MENLEDYWITSNKDQYIDDEYLEQFHASNENTTPPNERFPLWCHFIPEVGATVFFALFFFLTLRFCNGIVCQGEVTPQRIRARF